jgi:hypothetical protein
LRIELPLSAIYESLPRHGASLSAAAQLAWNRRWASSDFALTLVDVWAFLGLTVRLRER